MRSVFLQVLLLYNMQARTRVIGRVQKMRRALWDSRKCLEVSVNSFKGLILI